MHFFFLTARLHLALTTQADLLEAALLGLAPRFLSELLHKLVRRQPQAAPDADGTFPFERFAPPFSSFKEEKFFCPTY